MGQRDSGAAARREEGPGSVAPSHPRPGGGIKTSDECLLRAAASGPTVAGRGGSSAALSLSLATHPK